MPQSLSRAELIGRAGRDAELRHTAEGRAVATFSVATDRPARPGVEPGTDWHVAVCWERLAEVASQLVTKGRLLYLAGRLQYREWEDREEQKRRVAEIVASELVLLDRKPEPDLRVVGANESDLPF